MSYILEFRLPGLPKMSNTGLRGTHWSVKVKEAKHWKAMVHIACACRQPPKPLERARLTLTRVSSVCPDYDGLVSGFKHVVDGLVAAGVLTDDKPANIGTAQYLWESGDKGRGEIKIRVEGID